MGIRFTTNDTYQTGDNSCLEFDTDRNTVRLQSNAQLDLSLCEAPETLLFQESCGRANDTCATPDKITQKALDRRLIQPEEARLFQNRVRNLFGEMSADRQIDSRGEMEKLQRFEWDLSLKKISPLTENSGDKEAWLKADATDLLILHRLIRHDFTFEGATLEQKKKLGRLKETLQLKPWSHPEVLKHLYLTEISLGMGRTSPFFTLVFRFADTTTFYLNHEEEIESAVISFIRHYPEEVSTDLLGFFFQLLKPDEDPPGPLKKFLLGDETTPPSPILKQTLARSSWGYDTEFLLLPFFNGHPDLLLWVDSLLNDKIILPKRMEGFNQRTIYIHMISALLDFVFSENRNYPTPAHLQPIAEKFRKKWRETLPELYRKKTSSAFVLLHQMLTDEVRGRKRFETLEREWELKQKKLRRPYTPPDFSPLIQPLLVSDPLSETLQFMTINALRILGEKWNRPISVDLAVEAFHNVKSESMDRTLFKLLGEWVNSRYPEELRKKTIDFFDTGLPISKILGASHAYTKTLSEVIFYISTQELENSYAVLKEIALGDSILESSWDIFYTFERLIEDPDRYRGDPLETLTSVILADKNRRHADFAFNAIQRKFEYTVGDNVAPITDTLFRLAQEPHSRTIEAVNSLLNKAKSDSEPELRESLSLISIAGLEQGFENRPDETTWALRDLGILGHREAVGFLLERLNNPSASIHIERMLLETKKREVRQQICETATRKILEEKKVGGFLTLKDGKRAGLEESYQGLLEVALSREAFSQMSVEELLNPNDEELPESYWDVLENLDVDFAQDIGFPVTTDQEVPSQFHDYAAKIVDLTGDSHIGKAITRFYNERDRMERKAEKISAGKTEAEADSPAAQKRENSFPGGKTGERKIGEASFDPLATPPEETTGFTDDSAVSRSTRKTLTSPGSRLTVEVVDLDRKFPHPLTFESNATTTAADPVETDPVETDPADIADMILWPELPFENLETGLRFLIHAANLGDPRAQNALLTLIATAADMARADQEEGRIILQILAEEAPPFISGQAQAALEE